MQILSDREAFQAWKDSPATKEFLSFLRDRQSDLMSAWGLGAMMGPEQQAQAVLLGQLADLTWQDLADQYEWEVRDEQ